MHDEGDLRAMPATASRSRDRQAHVRVLVLQPGPAARSCRVPRAGRAPRAERRAGEVDRAMDSALRHTLAVRNTSGVTSVCYNAATARHNGMPLARRTATRGAACRTHGDRAWPTY